jgi:hypothetical protein
VWAIADVKRQGFLGFKEFVSAMQVSRCFIPMDNTTILRRDCWVRKSEKAYVCGWGLQVISPAQSGKDVSPNMLKNAGNVQLTTYFLSRLGQVYRDFMEGPRR